MEVLQKLDERGQASAGGKGRLLSPELKQICLRRPDISCLKDSEHHGRRATRTASAATAQVSVDWRNNASLQEQSIQGHVHLALCP